LISFSRAANELTDQTRPEDGLTGDLSTSTETSKRNRHLGVLEKVRRWIDGETAELVLEEAARNAQVKPRSVAEEFIVKIARAVEEVMQREMVPLPQGTTIIPTEYAIFLSDADDKEWQGIKRKGLEQGLYHILAERAKEIAGKKQVQYLHNTHRIFGTTINSLAINSTSL